MTLIQETAVAASAPGWGQRLFGEVGAGTVRTRARPPAGDGSNTWLQLSAAGGQTCGVPQTGRLLCWGFNRQGQLGDGTLTNRAHPTAVDVVKFGGAAFLIGYGLLAARRAWRPSALAPSEKAPARLLEVLVTCLALTWLNPHVYLDTVLLLGTVGNSYGSAHWSFALGAVTGSVLWFSGLGFGAGRLGRVLARPKAWRVLDGVIAVTMIMLGVAMVARS